MKKKSVEILLVGVEISGVPERRLPKSRNLGSVELIWPRTGIARKAAARELELCRGRADFTGETWTQRCLFREEIEGHCGLAVTVTEPVSLQKLRRFLLLSAKYALRQGADMANAALLGYADIATAPVDALAQMVGEKDSPRAIARGRLDLLELPEEGASVRVDIPLERPLTGKAIGRLTLEIRG